MIEYFVESASSYSGDIDNLFTLITVLVGFWFILVEGIFFYFIFRFRRKNNEKAQYITGETKQEGKWIHIPHYLVILCDVVIIGFTLVIWVNVKQTLPPADSTVRVVGQQWTWIFVHAGPDGKLDTEDDISRVNELHVQKDKTYHYHLESKDVLHSFSIPVFRLKQDAVPGRRITGWFKPTKTGEFDVQCAEMCGIGHGIMAAKVFIETEEEHQQWMAQAQSDYPSSMASRPSSPTEGFSEQLESSF